MSSSDALRNVYPGEPFRPSAANHNALVDAARAVRQSRTIVGRSLGGGASPAKTTFARISTPNCLLGWSNTGVAASWDDTEPVPWGSDYAIGVDADGYIRARRVDYFGNEIHRTDEPELFVLPSATLQAALVYGCICEIVATNLDAPEEPATGGSDPPPRQKVRAAISGGIIFAHGKVTSTSPSTTTPTVTLFPDLDDYKVEDVDCVDLVGHGPYEVDQIIPLRYMQGQFHVLAPGCQLP